VAATIKGITVEIGANTTGLGKALEDVNKKARSLQSELKQVDSLLKLNPGNAELVAQKQELLARAVANAKEKLETLRAAQAQVERQFASGQISDEQYRAFTREVAKAEGEVNRFENELSQLCSTADRTDDKVADVGDKAQAAGRDMENAGEKAHKFSGVLSGIAGGIGKAAAAGIAAVGAAAAAAGTAVVKMTLKAGEAADELSTLSNKTGISTKTLQEMEYAARFVDVPLETMTDSMFKLTRSMDAARDGTGAQAEAFKALGVSIRNSDGSLKNSKQIWLDTIDALGKVTNETERDALAMQLFGKNAKELNPLIAAGSDELSRLADEANELGVVLSDESVTALGDFDDKMQRLKATGTALTQTLGAAVAPALGALADNLRVVAASVTQAIQTGDWSKVGDGVSAMLTDIGSRIANALPQLAAQAAKIIGTLANAVVESLPQVLPTLLNAAIGLFESIIDAISSNAPALAKMAADMLSQLAATILKSLPVIISAGIQILIALIQGITQSIPQLIPAIVAAITQIAQTVIQNLPLIIQAGLRLIMALVQGIMDNLPVLITAIINMIPMLVQAVIDSLPLIIEAGVQILLAVVNGIVASLPVLIQAVIDMIPMVVTAIVENLPKIIEAGIQILLSLILGIIEALPQLIACIIEMIPKIVKAIVDNLPKIIEAGIKITLAVIRGIIEALPRLIQGVIDMIPQIVQAIIDNLPLIVQAGIEIVWALIKGLGEAAWNLIKAAGNLAWDFIKGIWEGIKSAADWLWQKISGFFNGIVNGVKNLLGIHSPSVVFAGIGKNMGLGLAEGITGSVSLVDRAMDRLNAAVEGAKADLSVNAQYAGKPLTSGNSVTLNIHTSTLDEGQINMLVNVVNRRLGLAY
jgi:phage-related minor tail protein